MDKSKDVLPPKPENMSPELYEQYCSWYKNPKRFEALYPIIFKQFIKPYLEQEKKHEED